MNSVYVASTNEIKSVCRWLNIKKLHKENSAIQCIFKMLQVYIHEQFSQACSHSEAAKSKIYNYTCTQDMLCWINTT